MSSGGIRVLALAAEAWGGRGGIAQSTRDLLDACANMPEIGAVQVLPRLQPELISSVPPGIVQYPPKTSKISFALTALWFGISRRPDVVYCGHAFMAPLARIVAWLAGAKCVSHVHGLEVWGPLSPRITRSLAASDLILCVSDYTARRVVETLNLPPCKCAVIYNSVNTRFVPGDRASARMRFNIPQEALVLSTVSRLDGGQRHKGHDRVIPLLPSLAREVPALVYLVAGTGSDRGRLEKLARYWGSQDYVRFLGFVPDEDLPDLYRASDLYVMPSHGEGFGIAFVEAMCCGTPALGLALGGAPDALRDGELGRAVDEAGFPQAFRDMATQSGIDRSDLATRARDTFGPSIFDARLAEAMKPLWRGTRSKI